MWGRAGHTSKPPMPKAGPGRLLALQTRPCKRPPCAGEVAEWSMAHAWKACLRETVTWVRIPLSPPVSPSATGRRARASAVACSDRRVRPRVSMLDPGPPCVGRSLSGAHHGQPQGQAKISRRQALLRDHVREGKAPADHRRADCRRRGCGCARDLHVAAVRQ